MHHFCILTCGCAAALAAACTDARQSGPPPAAVEGPAVVREGVVYLPAAVGPQGCVLYRMRIPGARAPAALLYRSLDGSFRHVRPEPCVTEEGSR